ncbi:MAG: hypothetical protein IT210_09130 [Armatimonadetes bacterium]|nr:hypothetical protein [Armatimonadota bacterium]
MRVIKRYLSGIWNLRRSKSRAVRAVWWLALAGLAARFLPFAFYEVGIPFAWMTFNIALLAVSAVWGLLHPRSLFAGREPGLKWAFWLALLSALAALSSTDTLMAQEADLQAIPLSALFLVVTLLLLPMAFLLLLSVSWLGAAVCAFSGRKGGDEERLARLGTGVWWLSLLLSSLTARAAYKMGAAPLSVIALVLSAPALAWAFGKLMCVPALDPQRRLRQILARITRRLVWRWRRKGGVRVIDLRGAVLGLLAAGMALGAGGSHLLVTAQSAALVSLMRARSGPLLMVFNPNGPQTISARRGRIVILEMDASTRHDALSRRSEAAVQAAVIRKLTAWNAASVALPVPFLYPKNQEMWHARMMGGLDIPLPGPEDISRNTRDAALLADAMRSAGNVLLTLPSEAPGYFQAAKAEDPALRSFRRLQKAALRVASAELPSFETVKLPAIPAESRPHPSLPAVLCQSARIASKGKAVPAIPPGDAPQAAPGKILVSFLSVQPGRDFVTLPYNSVLSGAALYQPETPIAPIRRIELYRGDALAPVGIKGRWIPPEAFFKGKIVFLDSLTPYSRLTPVGAVSQSEVMANAVATLLAGDYIVRPEPKYIVLGILLLGALIGHLCLKRDPFHTIWLLGVAVLLIMGGILLACIFGNLWLDPVIPSLTVLLAYLLVTEFTYSMERTERERNRALLQRFVAPQVVDELLEDPEAKLGLGGTRQRVCVLFVDARGFTQFAEQHTPEQVIEIINTYMTALTEVLHAHGGLLDKYTGDGLMALFRVQESPREDIERAVRAALAMRDAAEVMSRDRAAQGQPALKIGIGMHYGEAVVGLVGNPNQFNYTALGYTVVVSQRLQSIAAASEVIISESIYEEISGLFRVEEGQLMRVKGISAPVRPYRVVGADGRGLEG